MLVCDHIFIEVLDMLVAALIWYDSQEILDFTLSSADICL